MCAKFDAFTRFVTIFPLTDRTIITDSGLFRCWEPGTSAKIVTKMVAPLFKWNQTSTQSLGERFYWGARGDMGRGAGKIATGRFCINMVGAGEGSFFHAIN